MLLAAAVKVVRVLMSLGKLRIHERSMNTGRVRTNKNMNIKRS